MIISLRDICKRCDSCLLCKFVSFSLEYNPVHRTTSRTSELCIFDPILIELEEREKKMPFQTKNNLQNILTNVPATLDFILINPEAECFTMVPRFKKALLHSSKTR